MSTFPKIEAPVTRTVCQHTGAVVTADELAKAVKRYDNVKAELDNVLPVAWALEKALKVTLNVSTNYKLQAEEFELSCEELNERNFQLIDENASLRMRLEELGPHL